MKLSEAVAAYVEAHITDRKLRDEFDAFLNSEGTPERMRGEGSVWCIDREVSAAALAQAEINLDRFSEEVATDG